MNTLPGEALGRAAMAAAVSRSQAWAPALLQLVEQEALSRLQQAAKGNPEAADLPPQARVDLVHAWVLAGQQPQTQLLSAAAQALQSHKLALQVCDASCQGLCACRLCLFAQHARTQRESVLIAHSRLVYDAGSITCEGCSLAGTVFN